MVSHLQNSKSVILNQSSYIASVECKAPGILNLSATSWILLSPNLLKPTWEVRLRNLMIADENVRERALESGFSHQASAAWTRHWVVSTPNIRGINLIHILFQIRLRDQSLKRSISKWTNWTEVSTCNPVERRNILDISIIVWLYFNQTSEIGNGFFSFSSLG